MKNNPFTKPEQIDRFSDLAIESFETDFAPCDKFFEWWEKIGFQKSIDKYFIGRVVNYKDKNLDKFLDAEIFEECYKSTWIVDLVLSEIPN